MLLNKTKSDSLTQNSDERVRLCDSPIAPKGLISYRYNRGHGYIMLSATSPENALSQARWVMKKEAVIDNLEVWSGSRYMPQKIFDNLGFFHDPKYMNDKKRRVLF